MKVSSVSECKIDLASMPSSNLKEAIEHGLSFLTRSSLHHIVFERITTGNSTTQLYRFSIANEDFVLKILNAKACDNPNQGIEIRRNETIAHQTASKLGISPKTIYSDPYFLITIMRHIPGRPLEMEDLQNERRLALVSDLVKVLHSSPDKVSYEKAQLNRALAHYKRAISKGVAFPSCFTSLFGRFVQQEQQRQSNFLTLTHGDLHPGNIMFSSDQCFFIDWAYASQDYYLSDIAYLTVLCGMNPSLTLSFYSSYIGKTLDEQDIEHLERAQANTCLMLATSLFDQSGTQENTKSSMKERIQKLDSLLESSDLRNVQDYISGPNRLHPRQSNTSDIQLSALAFLKDSIRREGSLLN